MAEGSANFSSNSCCHCFRRVAGTMTSRRRRCSAQVWLRTKPASAETGWRIGRRPSGADSGRPWRWQRTAIGCRSIRRPLAGQGRCPVLALVGRVHIPIALRPLILRPFDLEGDAGGLAIRCKIGLARFASRRRINNSPPINNRPHKGFVRTTGIRHPTPGIRS
jgi:hypothetical protein